MQHDCCGRVVCGVMEGWALVGGGCGQASAGPVKHQPERQLRRHVLQHTVPVRVVGFTAGAGNSCDESIAHLSAGVRAHRYKAPIGLERSRKVFGSFKFSSALV